MEESEKIAMKIPNMRCQDCLDIHRFASGGCRLEELGTRIAAASLGVGLPCGTTSTALRRSRDNGASDAGCLWCTSWA